MQVELIRGSDWGGGVGGVLFTIRGTSRSYNAYNSRGDVVSVTNDSGTATWQAAYEAFGTRTDEDGTNAERQRANTKDEDPTGLLNEGFRYRDLEAGRFISRDPLGFVDGPNVYTYVRQNPWSAFDPYGLNEVTVSGGVNPDTKADNTHDNHWANFVKAADTKFSESARKSKEEQEWLVQKSSLIDRAKNEGLADNFYTSQVENIAKKDGVKLRWYNTTDDFVKMINTDPKGNDRSENQLISSFTYYGHGDKSGLWLTYEPGRNPGEVLTQSDLPNPAQRSKLISNGYPHSFIKPEAFAQNAKCISWACNSGTGGKESFIDAWATSLGMPMDGIVGRADYTNTSPTVFNYSYGMPPFSPETTKYTPRRHPTLGGKDGWGNAYWRTSGDKK